MRFYGKFLLIIVVAILVYASFLIFSDIQNLKNNFIHFKWEFFPIIISLITFSWLPIFFRWRLLLRNIGIILPIKKDLAIYVAGFALSVTPGKIGEFIRTQLIKEKFDVSRRKTVPIIFVEKLYDLAGAIITSITGIWLFQEIGYVFVVALSIFAIIFAIISSKRTFAKSVSWFSKFKISKKFLVPLTESYDIIRISTRGTIAMYSVLLSISYWLLTSLAVYFILLALDISNISYLKIIPTYAASLFLGAISLIPGGIGIAEGSLVGLLSLQGIKITIGVALVVIIRLFTLWYGVAVGFIALKLSGGLSLKS